MQKEREIFELIIKGNSSKCQTANHKSMKLRKHQGEKMKKVPLMSYSNYRTIKAKQSTKRNQKGSILTQRETKIRISTNFSIEIIQKSRKENKSHQPRTLNSLQLSSKVKENTFPKKFERIFAFNKYLKLFGKEEKYV